MTSEDIKRVLANNHSVTLNALERSLQAIKRAEQNKNNYDIASLRLSTIIDRVIYQCTVIKRACPEITRSKP